MKKCFTIGVLLSFAVLCAFAEGTYEHYGEFVSTTYSSEYADEITADVVVDLSSGTASKDIVKTSFDGTDLKITYDGNEPIKVELSGKIDSSVIVNSENSDITLILDNVEITGNSLPAMQLKSAVTYTLFIKGNTMNEISDRSSNSKKGAITSGGNVVFDGNGNLVLNVNKKHGIKTDGGVTLNSGTVNIIGSSDAEGNMISADTFFVMNGGTLNISANGNVKGSESKGIKVNGVEGKDFDCGYVKINEGTITICSVGKAITAGWKAEDDATTETTADDPVPDVFINGGTINITTIGTPREDTYTNGVCNDDGLSPEGIEAKHNLYITGGKIYIHSTDDCVNAGSSVIVSGGYSYLASSLNDSFDSNGTIEISGGTVFTYSTSNMEQAFDCDNDSNFTYKGGTFVGLGNGNNIPKGIETDCCSIAYGNELFRGGSEVAVLDYEDNLIIGFEIPSEIRNAGSIVIGSEKINRGQVYSLCYGNLTNKTSDGLSTDNSRFTKTSEIASFEMNDFTVSTGKIGMNVGQMPFDDGFGKRGFAPEIRDMHDMVDMQMRSPFMERPDAELPEGVILPDSFTEKDADQLINYLMQTYLFQNDGLNRV